MEKAVGRQRKLKISFNVCKIVEHVQLHIKILPALTSATSLRNHEARNSRTMHNATKAPGVSPVHLAQSSQKL